MLDRGDQAGPVRIPRSARWLASVPPLVKIDPVRADPQAVGRDCRRRAFHQLPRQAARAVGRRRVAGLPPGRRPWRPTTSGRTGVVAA